MACSVATGDMPPAETIGVVSCECVKGNVRPFFLRFTKQGTDQFFFRDEYFHVGVAAVVEREDVGVGVVIAGGVEFEPELDSQRPLLHLHRPKRQLTPTVIQLERHMTVFAGNPIEGFLLGGYTL